VSDRRLVLEILNGPLDGHQVKLEKETIWGKKGEGPLIFPWDAELGDPQTRFFCEGDEWWVEGFKAQHGTYILNREKRIEGKVRVEARDMLKASESWLLARKIE
jgi:hypothetical protein